jgi:hypothetical protein
MACNAQHTAYNPTDDQMRCPHCNAPLGQFYIEEHDVEADHNCDRLHVNDELHCRNCEHGTTGEEFAAKVMTEQKLKVCSCCKGAGVVKEEAL